MRTSRMVGRWLGMVVAGASWMVAVGMTGPAWAQQIVEPAPGSSAEASAVQIRPADTSVGTADAEADASGSQASATAIRVAGNDFGTTAANEGSGTSGTSAFEQQIGSDGYVRVLPRFVEATGNQSYAYSALADAEIPGFVRLQVLSGYAQAAWTPQRSTSNSTATGAHADLADGTLVVVLLRAEANGEGGGRLYVLRLNETTFVDSDSSQPVRIGVPGLADIELIGVNATSGSFTGRVVEALPLDDEGLSSAASSVSAAGGTGTTMIVDPPVTLDRPDTEVESRGGRLPRTGMDIMRIALVGFGLLILGAAMAKSARQAV